MKRGPINMPDDIKFFLSSPRGGFSPQVATLVWAATKRAALYPVVDMVKYEVHLFVLEHVKGEMT